MDDIRTIYIADDEENIRVAIKAFLENAGFTVKDFENGDLLLEAFSEQSPMILCSPRRMNPYTLSAAVHKWL
jgi:FixJ family two-component response regulator